jgi:hypothetical protein
VTVTVSVIGSAGVAVGEGVLGLCALSWPAPVDALSPPEPDGLAGVAGSGLPTGGVVVVEGGESLASDPAGWIGLGSSPEWSA